jgi:hypothetical protein
MAAVGDGRTTLDTNSSKPVDTDEETEGEHEKSLRLDR